MDWTECVQRHDRKWRQLTRPAKAAFSIGVSSHLAIRHSVDPAAAERDNYHTAAATTTNNNRSSQSEIPNQALPELEHFYVLKLGLPDENV